MQIIFKFFQFKPIEFYFCTPCYMKEKEDMK